MKKLILTSLSSALLLSTASAYQPLVAPQVPYPTALIGSFMSFCTTTMDSKASLDPTNQYVSRQVIAQTHVRVCSCIMDQFRFNNEQAVFDREFKAAHLKDVPYFVKYLRECGDINNQENILKYGS